MEYRTEHKYLCTDAQLLELRQRLSAVLPYDKHQDGDCYRVRSLYFDTWDNQLFHENAAGIDERCKYRIRIYNCSKEKISFEIKHKLHEKTKKESSPLSVEDCIRYLTGAPLSGLLKCDTILNQVYLKNQTDLLKPVSIIDYERTAFIYPIGNVRITFDRNLAVSGQTADFFNPSLPMLPILPPHQHILEIKYDELLPDFIAQTLELGNLRRTSFSKYFLGREALYYYKPTEKEILL